VNCQDYETWITGYIDGELPEPDRRRLEEHLEGCRPCRLELERLTALKEELAMLKFKEPGDAELRRYWSGIYNRLERGVGWILFSLGAIIALGCGTVLTLEAVLEDTEVPLLMKVGIFALAIGLVVLLVSMLRERLTLRKTDKYSREVQR
jgi:hypothetical protein